MKRHKKKVGFAYRAWPLLMLLLLVPMLGSATEPAPVGDAAINVSAVDQEWVDDTWRGIGNVRILYQDIEIECDEMIFDRQSMDLEARGNVVLDQGPTRFSAARLQFNLRTKTGVFYDAQGELPPTYQITGAEIEKLDETRYRIEDATFTSCEPEPRPPWRFHVRRALIENEGYGRFRGTSLRVKEVPIFYMPYLLWPIKFERSAGLLMPTFGYSQRRGGYLGNALFMPIGRSYDTTIYLDGYSRGNIGVGSEWRWAPKKDNSGEIEAYTIYDPDEKRWEWKVNGKHQQDDFFGFRLLAEVHDLSDIDFFQEFERSYNQNTMRSLYSYLYLTRSWGPFSLNMRMDRRTTFQLSSGAETKTDIVLNQLPEVELRVRPTRLGSSRFYWNMVSSLNYLDVDRGETAAGDPLTSSYGRVDLFPSISYSVPGPPWLSVTPRVGVRGTYYTARYSEGSSIIEDEPVQRAYLDAGLDIVGPSFSRIFEGKSTKVKHLIEPRIEYRYLADIDDSYLSDVNGYERSLVPIFDEVDSNRIIDQARFTLANRVFVRAKDGVSAREMGSLELYQDYSFAAPLSGGSSGQTSRRGPLGASLTLTPVEGMSFDARARYDTLYSQLTAASLSASVRRENGSLGLTWYESYAASTGDRSSSQIRTSIGVGGSSMPLQLQLHLSYDVEKSEFQQQRALFRYEGDCWGLTVEYRDLRVAAFPTRDYRISIDFKGVGRLLEVQGGFDP